MTKNSYYKKIDPDEVSIKDFNDIEASIKTFYRSNFLLYIITSIMTKSLSSWAKASLKEFNYTIF